MQEPATTLAPETPPQEPQPEDAPSTPLTDAIEQEPQPQPETPEGELSGAEETPEAPEWTPDKVEETLKHDAFASHLEEREKKARSEAQARLQPIYQKALQTAQATNQQIENATVGWEAFSAQAESLMTEGNTDANEWRRVFREHARTLAGVETAFKRYYRADGFWDGSKDTISALAKAAGEDAVGTEFSQRMVNVQQGADPTWAHDFLERLGVGDVKQLRRDNDRLKKSNAELQAKLNAKAATVETGPPDLGGSPGSSDINERRRAYADGEINEYPG